MRGFQPAKAKAKAQPFANGGPVRGPGTGTSDDIKTSVPDGTYIMPADSTAAVGEQALAKAGARGFTPGGNEKVPVNLSNGEFKLPPEQVHAVGVQALDQIKNATHTPAARGFSPGKQYPVEEPRFFFADGGVVKDEEKKNSFGDAAAASLDSRVSQIPTGGPKAPAPDGRSDTELSRNVNNALNAMGGMGVVSSVPLRQPPASTALATVTPSAGFASGALAKTGELATAAAPQAAQAARGLPGTIAGLQEGAQANSYAAAGRTLGGASAGATALDNNRPADPMAQPKVNSFGDASAVARGASAALPSAGALSMGTAPQAAPQASPQVTTPEARKAVGLFPYSSPDAGKNIYAGVGFGKGGEQQAAGAAPRVTTPDPMAAHNQKLEAAQGLQSWRQSPGASSSPAARQNYLDLQQKAVDMQPSYFAQQGPMAAQAPAAAESAASSALQSMYTQKPPAAASTPAAAPDANPYANVTPEQGRAMADINANAQPLPSAPQPQSPAAMAMQTTGDVKRDGNSYSGTNVAGDITINGQAPRNGGLISAQNMAAADALAGRQQQESMGRVTAAQQLTAPNMNVSAPTVRHSGNDWAARKALENAATSASSIMNNGGRWDQHGKAGSPEGAAYRAMLGTDQALRQAQPGMDQEAMRQNAGMQREGIQQQGANARTQMQEAGQNSRFGQTQGLAQQKFGMEREAQGFTSRAAAQSEQLRNTLLDPKATPEQRSIAQRNLAALSGKTAADRMQTVALPDTTTDTGQVVRGGQALVRTLEDGTVVQVPVGAAQQGGAQPLPPGMKRQVGTSNGRPVYEDMNGKQVIAKG